MAWCYQPHTENSKEALTLPCLNDSFLSRAAGFKAATDCAPLSTACKQRHIYPSFTNGPGPHSVMQLTARAREIGGTDAQFVLSGIRVSQTSAVLSVKGLTYSNCRRLNNPEGMKTLYLVQLIEEFKRYFGSLSWPSDCLPFLLMLYFGGISLFFNVFF